MMHLILAWLLFQVRWDVTATTDPKPASFTTQDIIFGRSVVTVFSSKTIVGTPMDKCPTKGRCVFKPEQTCIFLEKDTTDAMVGECVVRSTQNDEHKCMLCAVSHVAGSCQLLLHHARTLLALGLAARYMASITLQIYQHTVGTLSSSGRCDPHSWRMPCMPCGRISHLLPYVHHRLVIPSRFKIQDSH